MNRRETDKTDTRPMKILFFLYIVIVLGVLTAGITFFYGQKDTRQNIEVGRQNQEFLKRIEWLEKEQKKAVTKHRLRNEVIHADLCRLVFEVIEATSNPKFDKIEPCDVPLEEEDIKNDSKEP